jgi:hypothetical protein
MRTDVRPISVEAERLIPRWIRLACPRCGRSIEVSPGARARCTRCPGLPEMERAAT